MGRFIVVGVTDQPVIPFVWKPRSTAPRFVIAATPVLPVPMLGPATVDILPEPAAEPVAIPATVDILSEPTDDLSSLAMEDKMAMEPSDDPESTSGVEDKLLERSIEPVSTPAMADKMALELSANPASNPAVEDRVARGRSPEPLISKPSVADKTAPTSTQQPRPLSHNLLSIRRALSLTPEEFSRPIIDDGEGLINRLEAGFSRPSYEISRMICDAWGINNDYLFTGRGAMFEKDSQSNPADYTAKLLPLLKTYLSVATFDRKGIQYWKGSLVDDLCRLLDVGRMDGRCMSRVVRVLYDYLDVDQFCEVLERMGR